MKIGDRVKYVGSNGYYNPQRLGKFGIIKDRYDDISVNVISESGDVWCGVYDANLEVVKNTESRSPIREVRRREIVAGNYGIVAITKNNKVMIAAGDHSSDELDEAAHILNQLAEVKRENGK